MKKKYAGDESENEFSVDEPEELQGSDDDWTPAAGELADMHLIYGEARCDSQAARDLYAERYPSRRLPSHVFFQRLHDQLRETGSSRAPQQEIDQPRTGGRRQSRRLRNSSATKKPRLTEPSTSEEEEDLPSDEDSDSENQFKKKKVKVGPKGRGRGKKVQVTSTSPPGAKLKPTGETTISCEATSTTTSSPAHVAPVEKEFTSGAFVVLKTDFQNGGDPPIWKIDGKALLQKYIPFEQDGKTLYKNTSTYSGWSANNKELYYPAAIAFKMQNRKETIVEFLRDSIKEVEVGQEHGTSSNLETILGI